VARPSVVQALLIVLAIAVGAAAFIGLNFGLGLKEYYAGFFFIFFWLGLEKGDLKVFPSTAAGAFFGVALGFALHELPALLGAGPGMLVFLGLVVVTLFFLVRQQLQIVANNSAMLFLTLSTVVHIQGHADFRDMFESLALTVALVGSVAWLVGRQQANAAARNAAAAAPQT